MKCLLIDSHWQRAEMGPRLSLGCLASAVRNLVDVEAMEFVLDEEQQAKVKQKPAVFWTLEQEFLGAVENRVRNDPEILVVGVTGWSGSFPRMLRIAECCKNGNPRVAVVFGGPHVTLHEKWCPPEQSILKTHQAVDFLVLGDGEESFHRLIRGLLTGSTSCSTRQKLLAMEQPGTLGERARGQVRVCRRSPGLHWAPFLASRPSVRRRVFFVESARGCPHKCTFCDERDVWTRYQRRDVREIVNEVEHGMRLFNTRSFRFSDSSLTANPAVASLCEEMVRRDLRARWSAFAHCSEVTARKAAVLQEAGCRCVLVGVESGEQSVLDAMNKGTTRERIKTAVNVLQSHGIHVRGSFIIGYPGETLAQARRTIAFATELGLDACAWHLYQPPFRLLWARANSRYPDFAHYELDNPPEVALHVLKRDPALLRDMHALPRLVSLAPDIEPDPTRWPKRSVGLLHVLQEALSVTGEAGHYDLDLLAAHEPTRYHAPVPATSRMPQPSRATGLAKASSVRQQV